MAASGVMDMDVLDWGQSPVRCNLKNACFMESSFDKFDFVDNTHRRKGLY